jgi:cobalt-zinc-cadmium efflux system protein
VSHDHASHSDGHDRAGHDHAADASTAHDHAGHDHAGHDHAGHDHAGHSHAGHSHAGHSHAGHSHAPANFDRAFAFGISLNAIFVIVEVVYGYRAHSLSLVADAGHNLGDVLGLVLAWAGSVLVRKRATERRTYGLRRFSILAALANACVLLISVGGIAVEALRRMADPPAIGTTTVMVVATIGILINGATALAFARGRAGDINIRGAYLHMLGDAATSAGVVISALIISFTAWNWIDPVSSLIISGLILWSAWGLALDSFNLAVDAVPRGIDPKAVREGLLKLDGVTDVHHLHIWGLSTTEVALTAHLVRPCEGGEDEVLTAANAQLKKAYGIAHATLQIERGENGLPCKEPVPAPL